MRNLPEKDAERLEKKQVEAGVKCQKVIAQQEAVIEAADKGTDRINADLKALRKRLDKYTKQDAKFDELYYELTDRYRNKLSERAALERARSIAQESITAAKLHMIPGETTRGEMVSKKNA